MLQTGGQLENIGHLFRALALLALKPAEETTPAGLGVVGAVQVADSLSDDLPHAGLFPGIEPPTVLLARVQFWTACAR